MSPLAGVVLWDRPDDLVDDRPELGEVPRPRQRRQQRQRRLGERMIGQTAV